MFVVPVVPGLLLEDRSILRHIRITPKVGLIFAFLFIAQALHGQDVSRDEGAEENPFALPERLLDYDTLDLRLSVEYFRAGNHNESGVHNYHFEVSLIALHDIEADHLEEFEKRKKLVHPYGQFAKLTIPSFKHLQSSEEESLAYLNIKGDAVREMVRKAMNAWSTEETPVSEKDVSVQFHLELVDEQTMYHIWNTKNKIISQSYFIVPFRSREQKLYQDQQVSLTDDRGLQIQMQITYMRAPEKKSIVSKT
ncbi:MAG: hypothetical protein OXT67_12630 [Zetaproteobacteria bacterium]|nr:hypothetical protein [Zetaproteobacteria bacterium]